jgi:hypothetical protein
MAVIKAMIWLKETAKRGVSRPVLPKAMLTAFNT